MLTLATLSLDGSATYSTPTHTIQAGISYPLETTRSRERPDTTSIEIALRPHNAVTSTRERHYESLLTSFLSSLIIGEATPRCLLQATLQVTQVVEDESLPGGVKGGLGLDVLAGAGNALIAGCMDAGVQMRCVGGCVVLAVTPIRTAESNAISTTAANGILSTTMSIVAGQDQGNEQNGPNGTQSKTTAPYSTGTVTSSGEEIVLWPTVLQRKHASSLHVFGYGSNGQCFLTQSEGRFRVEEFEMVENLARWAVLERYDSVIKEIRDAVEARVVRDLQKLR